MKTKIKCSSCGYEWETKSNHVFVTCPSCLQKQKVNKEEDALLIGDEIDMTKNTKLKFVCYGKILQEYPLKGFHKGETNNIKQMLSKAHNVPEDSIHIEVD